MTILCDEAGPEKPVVDIGGIFSSFPPHSLGMGDKAQGFSLFILHPPHLQPPSKIVGKAKSLEHCSGWNAFFLP